MAGDIFLSLISIYEHFTQISHTYGITFYIPLLFC